MSKYTVRVTNEFRSITSAGRSTAGITVPTDGNGWTGDLSKDQLAELANDRYVTVENASGDVIESNVPTGPVNTEQETAQRLDAEAEQDTTPQTSKDDDAKTAVVAPEPDKSADKPAAKKSAKTTDKA